MTIDIESFNTEKDLKDAKLRTGIRHKSGWRCLETNLDDLKIKWVNGPDDPDNSQQRQQRTLLQQRMKDLIKKILDDTITSREIIEYERLKIQTTGGSS